jgi:Pyruvate/2-oxoacid:ferredoxin oxidoreductase delta subunit
MERAMKSTPAYRTLAEKLVFLHNNKDFNIPESLLKVVSFAFTEEEAQIASHLSYFPRTAKAIARKVMRPLHEVDPVLESLAQRVLIISVAKKNKTVYSLLPFVPGIAEGQLIWSRLRDEEYGKQFAGLFEDFFNEAGDMIKPILADREKFEIGRVIPIEKSIQGHSSLNAIAFPSDHFSEVIDRNTSFALTECPCRTATEYLDHGCDKPRDVCGGMGLIADFVIQKGIARRVSKEEFIDAKVRAAEAGLVNFVDNMVDPGQACACCSCCCYALRLLTQHNFPALLANSHFEPVIDTQKCKGCSKCMEWCPVNAIYLNDKKSEIDYIKCIGCGICVSKCRNNSISLRERANYQPPPDNIVEFTVHRYLEAKRYDKNGLLPRASLGMGRLLAMFFQHKVGGPKYKPSG